MYRIKRYRSNTTVLLSSLEWVTQPLYCLTPATWQQSYPHCPPLTPPDNHCGLLPSKGQFRGSTHSCSNNSHHHVYMTLHYIHYVHNILKVNRTTPTRCSCTLVSYNRTRMAYKPCMQELIFMLVTRIRWHEQLCNSCMISTEVYIWYVWH